MESITIVNYDETKEALINYLIYMESNCNHEVIQISLQADPKVHKLHINNITYRGYYNPYEVILEKFDACSDDSISRYFTSIKDIADALGKTMSELIAEVANQPEYIDWMDPIDVTYEDVRNYVCTVEQYMEILDDLYAEYIRTDCYELIEDRATTLLDDAIELMEMKYTCEIELKEDPS